MTSDWIPVSCPCGTESLFPPSFRGEIANCPVCGKAVPVPGGVERIFWLLLAAALALVAWASALAWWLSGTVVVGAIGLAAVGLVGLCS